MPCTTCWLSWPFCLKLPARCCYFKVLCTSYLLLQLIYLDLSAPCCYLKSAVHYLLILKPFETTSSMLLLQQSCALPTGLYMVKSLNLKFANTVEKLSNKILGKGILLSRWTGKCLWFYWSGLKFYKQRSRQWPSLDPAPHWWGGSLWFYWPELEFLKSLWGLGTEEE